MLFLYFNLRKDSKPECVIIKDSSANANKKAFHLISRYIFKLSMNTVWYWTQVNYDDNTHSIKLIIHSKSMYTHDT